MPTGLCRIRGGGDWHFITPGSPDPRFAGWGGCSCYRRQPFLGSARRRDLFLKILEEVRAKYQFIVAGYVVMPEHFHLLVSELAVGSPPLAMQVLKQRMSRRCRRKKNTSGQLLFWEEEGQEQPPAFWQRRYYDFNVYTERKYIEKLR